MIGFLVVPDWDAISVHLIGEYPMSRTTLLVIASLVLPGLLVVSGLNPYDRPTRVLEAMRRGDQIPEPLSPFL